MKIAIWEGKEIRGIIRILEVNCAPIRVCAKDDGKTVAEIASNEMVMGAVWEFYGFPLLVSQQNHSNLSFIALDNAHKGLNQMKGIF
jgi:hypothetical protein